MSMISLEDGTISLRTCQSLFPPPLNPGTMEPARPEELEAIFPKEIIRQEMSSDRYIDIPEEVRDAYVMLGRPSPLQRATRLEKMLKTPAKIYLRERI